MNTFIPWLLALLSNLSMLFILRVIKDQRGETVIDKDTEDEYLAPADDDGDEDIDDNEELDGEDTGVQLGDEDEEEEGEEEKKAGDEDEEEPETLESLTERYNALDKQYKDSTEAVKNLNIALHNERQTKKATKEEDTDDGKVPLTDAQLVGLLEEHKDDPATQLNIIKYVAKEAAKAGDKKTINEAEISRTQKEVSHAMNTAYPDLMKDDSEIRVKTNQAKSSLFLDEHPMGDFLALSALIHYDLDNIRQSSFEEGKKVALGEKAEVTRKKGIKSNDLAPPGKGAKANAKTVLTGEQGKIARNLGLSKEGQKIYQKLLDKKTAIKEI